MFVAIAKLLISKQPVSENASLTGHAAVWLQAYKTSFLASLRFTGGDGRGKLCHYYDGDSAPRILMRKIMTRTRRHIHNTSSKSTSHSCYLTSFWIMEQGVWAVFQGGGKPQYFSNKEMRSYP